MIEPPFLVRGQTRKSERPFAEPKSALGETKDERETPPPRSERRGDGNPERICDLPMHGPTGVRD